MGLDMYLNATTYVSGYEFSSDKNKDQYRQIVEAFDAAGIVDKDSPSGTVSLTALYWRKANAIHKWFVDNVQSGVDDCGTYYVSDEQLQSLRDICQQIVDDPSRANELLPAASGFFFGSTDYDEWYFDDLKRTVEQIDRILPQKGQWYFEYHSSW